MQIKSFGCSFIYGSDHADEWIESSEAPSQSTWPALLAKKLNLSYECYARAGHGNLRILESILSNAVESQKDLFVIGWTWIDRFDYTDTHDCWKTILPANADLQTDFYYRNFHSQYKDKLTTLIYIRTAIDTLMQKQIPFLMTFMDELIFETDWHTTPAVIDMQNYVRPFLSSFNGNTFLDWSKKQKFPISGKMHPLEEAHSAAAHYMFNEIQNWADGNNISRLI